MSEPTATPQTKSARLFPGVPLIESPVFESETLEGFKEQEKTLARSLHADGFGVIDFPDPEIDARIDRIRRNLGPRYDIPLDDPAAEKTKGDPRIQDAWTEDEDVHAIASNPAILDLLSKLYGRRAFPFQTLNGRAKDCPRGTRSSDGVWCEVRGRSRRPRPVPSCWRTASRSQSRSARSHPQGLHPGIRSTQPALHCRHACARPYQ